jgi:surface protein
MVIFLIPIIVFADDDNTCEIVNTSNEKTMEISLKQDIIGNIEIQEQDLDKYKFTYKIMDLDNNVLDETTNDENGNITFHCFRVKASNIGNYRLYKIIMEESQDDTFDSDEAIIYFSLRPNSTNGLFDPIIAYYKDDEDTPEKYNTVYKGEVFHATEEELQGQAYAVIDKDTKELTFFRDEPNKYTNKQVIGNKIYYAGFEEHEPQSWYNSWSGWRDDGEILKEVKKIVFQDAIKPNNITGWFEGMPNLEEVDVSKLDTSNLTGIDYFLLNCPKVKEVDISTFDLSNVKSLTKSFYNTGIEYLDFSVWDFNPDIARVSMGEFVSGVSNLRYLNISNFGNWSSSAEFGNLYCLEKLEINDTYDFYRSAMLAGIDLWYNPEKNRSYTFFQIKNNIYNHAESMTGGYIRPMCNYESPKFMVNYNPPVLDVNPKEEIDAKQLEDTKELENPNTKDRIIIALVSLIICSLMILYLHKKEKSLV